MSEVIPLEDSWVDVLRKARKGLSLAPGELERRSGLSCAEIASLEAGNLKHETLGKLAITLGLDPIRLLALARSEYHPGKLKLPLGMLMFSTPWHEYEVNSFLVWDSQTESPSPAAAFDTGADASDMIGFLRVHHLALTQVFLTHGHGDHVFDLERLLEKSHAHAWIGTGEEFPAVKSLKTFEAGREFFVGSLRIETRSTWGHTAGGITYVIHGLARPVAIVGDSLFAGSMGGPIVSYKACLENNRREILSLPADTLICPGHGPLTTVALERKNNPFFGGLGFS